MLAFTVRFIYEKLQDNELEWNELTRAQNREPSADFLP